MEVNFPTPPPSHWPISVPLNTENLKDKVQPCFQALSKYLLPEIESLADKRANEEGIGNFSIPLAATLFLLLDFLGYLIRKDTDTDTDENFRAILLNDSYFPNSYRSEDIELVIQIYRHSITHTVFPRATAGIGKYENEQALLIRDGNQLILNVHVLAKDFINAYEKLRLRIEQSDEDLMKTISTRLEKMRDNDLKKYADTIKYYGSCEVVVISEANQKSKLIVLPESYRN